MAYSKQDAIEAVKEVSKKVDGSLSKRKYKELRQEGQPSAPTMYQRLGGWNEIKKEAKVESEKSGGKLDANFDYFESITTDEQAYWLGFLMGDGSVYENQVGNLAVAIGIHKRDRELLERYKEALESEHSIRKGNDNVYHQIVDKKLASDLARHGIDQQKTFSDSLPDIDDELWPGFIRGLFDADGSAQFSVEGKTEWYISGDKARMEALQPTLPVDAQVVDAYARNEDTRKLSVCAIEDVQTLRDWMYEDATVYLGRKRSKLDAVRFQEQCPTTW